MKNREINFSRKVKFNASDNEDYHVYARAITYGKVEGSGDIIKEGCFDNYVLKEFPNDRLKMYVNHDSFDLPIGEWTKLELKDDGVYAFGRFLDTNRGKDARKVILDGLIDSVSISLASDEYEMHENEWTADIITAKLREISITPDPADYDAKIVRANSKKSSIRDESGYVKIRVLEKALRDAGLSRKEAKQLIAEGAGFLKKDLSEDQFYIDMLNSICH